MARPRTRVMVNVGDPEQAFRLVFLPNDGVGLARLEFTISGAIQVHPLALTRFVEAFSACTEGWERTPLPSRAAALQGLGPPLEGLRRAGLFVHWATVERNLAPEGRAPVPMAVAIVTVTRTRLPTVRARVPRQIAGVTA